MLTMSKQAVSVRNGGPEMALIYCFCILIAFTAGSELNGQEKAKRPTVGLALSGGGAHGITHLGVIKVMEEAGLRPDYITGVSMGSIIGGLYSLGYSADSLYKILKKADLELLLSNKIPENKAIFLEKYHFNNSILSLPLSQKRVKFPSGLINGQQIENMLSYYSWPAADITDFSRLPIPFMCLATDIINFRKIDLKKGYLPDAMRASSAVPSIFTPLKIDSLLLVDGGLTRNFAPAEVKEMGADIVIGSYCGFQPLPEQEFQTVSGIIKQISMFRSLEDFESQKKMTDILIKPETKGFPIYDFRNVDSLIARGYKAALPYKEVFRKLADSLNSIGVQKPLDNILDKQTYIFNKIEINGNKTYPDYQIKGVLDIQPGEKTDKNLLSEKMELLYGKAWFEKVKYRIVPRNDSLILVIDCIEQPRAMLYGSVHYDNSLLAGIILNLSLKNFLTPESVITIKSYIAQYYRFDINFIQFLDRNQKYGLSLNFFSDNTLLPLMQLRDEKDDAVSRNFVPGVSLIRRIGLNHMMGLSFDFENADLIPHYTSDDHIKRLSFNYFSEYFDYQINTLNEKHFPDRGAVMKITIGTSKMISGSIRSDSLKTVSKESMKSDIPFDRFFTISGRVKQYFSSSGKLTFSVGGNFLLITNSDSVSAQNNNYFLGGIESVGGRSIAMTGFHSNEIAVKKLAGLNGGIDFELFENFHLNAMADICAIQEKNRSKGYSLLSGYGIGVGYMSIIGPIKIGIMQGNYSREEYFNKTKGYFSLGFNF